MSKHLKLQSLGGNSPYKYIFVGSKNIEIFIEILHITSFKNSGFPKNNFRYYNKKSSIKSAPTYIVSY